MGHHNDFKIAATPEQLKQAENLSKDQNLNSRRVRSFSDSSSNEGDSRPSPSLALRGRRYYQNITLSLTAPQTTQL